MQNAHIAKINLAARMIGVGVLAAAIPVAGLLAASCAAPVRELEVEGIVKQISSAQTTLGVVTRKKIYVWDWSDLDQPPQTGIPRDPLAVTLLAGPRVLAKVKPRTPGHEYDLLLTDLDGQEVYGRWPSGEEWRFAEVRSSRTGEFAGIVSQESAKRIVSKASTKRGEADRGRRLGVLPASGGEIIWMPVIMVRYTNNTYAVVVSDDGAFVAAVGVQSGAWIAMASVAERKILWHKATEGRSGIADAAFSPDGKVLYTGGLSEVCGYDVGTGDLLTRWTTGLTYGHRITKVATSPDGRFVAAGSGIEGKVFIWDARTGKRLMVLPTGLHTTYGLAFSPDSTRLATSGVEPSGVVRIWAMPPPEPAEEPKPPEGPADR